MATTMSVMKILAADNDRVFLTGLLQASLGEVSVLADLSRWGGDRLLDRLRTEWPNILMLDVGIMCPDGSSVLPRLYDMTLDRPLSVIGLLSDDGIRLREFAGMFGIKRFLQKPCTPGETLDSIYLCLNDGGGFKSLDNRIGDLLLSLGLSSHYEGFELARESLRIFSSLGRELMAKELYIQLAQARQVSPASIEINLRNAIHEAGRSPTAMFSQMFADVVSNRYPSNLVFLRRVFDYSREKFRII